MTLTQQHSTLAQADCGVVFDNLTRQLYATDASHYEVEPLAVAFPRDAQQARSVILAAAQVGVPITPRGAGTGLMGGAIGEGVVLDFSRHNKRIIDFDREKQTVRVGAGVVLDDLNSFLKPFNLTFGPDVATSSRATIGGMIANNSSGARAAYYGTTADHVTELEVVMADGRILKTGLAHETLRAQRELFESMAMLNAISIGESYPDGLLKRWPGYALDRIARDPGNPIQVLAGSEGTLAAILSAEIKVVPLPEEVGVALMFFDSVQDAMMAAMELESLRPVAVEHIDRILLDQTRGRREFKVVRDMLELDAQPCEAILAAEFYHNVGESLDALQRLQIGKRHKILSTYAEMTQFWNLRKAGLSLLTSRRGGPKPVTCIEDTAVRPCDLPKYHSALDQIMRGLGLQVSYYGHAASGLLHVRPVLDLHLPGDLKKFRQITGEVAALVKQFKGSFCAEHGVGLGRTEFVKGQVGEEMYALMRQIKKSFDPNNLFNPGKIISDGRYSLDTRLRRNLERPLQLPFEPVLRFSQRDESFVDNLEQCNGCGGCRKSAPAMCPTFIATGEEIMSTRGRANAIRAALERRPDEGGNAIRPGELSAVLSQCLGCKACDVECPSNVNMSLLKAELSHAQIQAEGLTLSQRLISSLDKIGRIGTKSPWLANMVMDSFVTRHLLQVALGVSARRPLLHFARQRFDEWFALHHPPKRMKRGRVILWDDTFVRYHEPEIGMAAVKVLEAAGYAVMLPSGRACCGRPAFSQGNLDEASRLGRHNLALLSGSDNTPILFLEPSCHSMFVQDYLELGLPYAENLAARCFLFEEFLDDLLRREPGALRFDTREANIVVHAHCHAKAITGGAFLHRLPMRLPERRVAMLNTGCCGMAGAFGGMSSNYELSLKIAEPLITKIKEHPFGTVVIASGASCRQQISHLAPVRPRHIAEVLAGALAPGHT